MENEKFRPASFNWDSGAYRKLLESIENTDFFV